MYVYFGYVETSADIPPLDICERTIDTLDSIDMMNVEHGLGYVVFLADGKIDVLEIFTYGAVCWDGNTEGFLGWKK